MSSCQFWNHPGDKKNKPGDVHNHEVRFRLGGIILITLIDWENPP